ncbi:MAG: hypothetical protein PVI30_05090 [Myxococcales bacterium]|jgi:hypothetical protein
MRARVLLPSLLLTIGGCAMPPPPGELVGEYAVDGALMENTCGSDAVPAVDPLRFQVQLRDDEGVGLWLMSPPAREGTLEGDGSFRFELERVYPVEREPGQRVDPELLTTDPEAYVDEVSLERFDPASNASDPGCALRVVEQIEGAINRRRSEDEGGAVIARRADADDGIADMVADNRIEIRVASGARCGFVLAEAGGPFERLPCSLRYDLEGELLDDQPER